MVLDFVGNQKNASHRLKWIKKRLLGGNRLDIPIERKPIYYYDPLIKIKIEEEIVDIFRGKQIKGRTKEELIDIYLKVKKLIGHSPNPNEISKYGNVSYSLYANRFGSWEGFKKQFDDQRIHTKERIIKQYKSFYETHKFYPSIRDGRKYKLISDNTIRNLWGSYAKFIEDIGGTPRKHTKLDLSKKRIILDYKKIKEELNKIPFEYEMQGKVKYNWGSALRQYFGGEHIHFMKIMKDYKEYDKRIKSIDRGKYLRGRKKWSKEQIINEFLNIKKKKALYPNRIELRERKFKNLPSFSTIQNYFKIRGYKNLIKEIEKEVIRIKK